MSCRTDRIRAESITGETEFVCHRGNQRRQHFPHVIGQVTAVRPGAGDQFLLIEILGEVQGLLSREAEDPVRVTLQARQVVEERWLLKLFFGLDVPDHGFSLLQAESSKIVSRFLFLKMGKIIAPGTRFSPWRYVIYVFLKLYDFRNNNSSFSAAILHCFIHDPLCRYKKQFVFGCFIALYDVE